MSAGNWTHDVLKAIGAPVTTGNIKLLKAWQRWEGGHTNNDATWNWLNTTLGKQFRAINSVGVRAFPDYKTGVAYTADTILGGYPAVVSALRSGKPYVPKYRPQLVSDFSKWVSGSRTARPDYGERILGTKVSARAPASTVPKGAPASRGKMQDLSWLAGVLDDGDDFWDLVQMAPLEMPETAAPASRPTPTAGVVNPGGGWGGSYSIAKQLADLSALQVTSEKRDRQHTASGGVSDHWTGSKNAYAFDLGGTPQEMDEAAKKILAKLGIDWDGKSSIVQNVHKNGYRIQILYRTNVGGNHYDHIHVGVRKV